IRDFHVTGVQTCALPIFDIDAPQPTDSESYQQELQAVRTAVENSSTEQKRAVKYWTNNPAIRWNELAMELIAKYNLISGPNADGSYTLPNPANLQGPPPFPFAIRPMPVGSWPICPWPSSMGLSVPGTINTPSTGRLP